MQLKVIKVEGKDPQGFTNIIAKGPAGFAIRLVSEQPVEEGHVVNLPEEATKNFPKDVLEFKPLDLDRLAEDFKESSKRMSVGSKGGFIAGFRYRDAEVDEKENEMIVSHFRIRDLELMIQKQNAYIKKLMDGAKPQTEAKEVTT